MMMRPIFQLTALLLLIACGGKNTGSNVETPGEEKSGQTKLLEAGADILQKKSPISKINAYLDGFHFYNGNMHAQMEAHHYVSQLSEDFHQNDMLPHVLLPLLSFRRASSAITM